MDSDSPTQRPSKKQRSSSAPMEQATGLRSGHGQFMIVAILSFLGYADVAAARCVSKHSFALPATKIRLTHVRLTAKNTSRFDKTLLDVEDHALRNGMRAWSHATHSLWVEQITGRRWDHLFYAETWNCFLTQRRIWPVFPKLQQLTIVRVTQLRGIQWSDLLAACPLLDTIDLTFDDFESMTSPDDWAGHCVGRSLAPQAKKASGLRSGQWKSVRLHGKTRNRAAANAMDHFANPRLEHFSCCFYPPTYVAEGRSDLLTVADLQRWTNLLRDPDTGDVGLQTFATSLACVAEDADRVKQFIHSHWTNLTSFVMQFKSILSRSTSPPTA